MRKVGEYYCIAIGKGFGFKVGTKVVVTLEKRSFKAIVADTKQDRHTINGKVAKDGSVIEFIVDVGRLSEIVRLMGSVGEIEKFSGDVVKIEKEK